MRSSVYYSLLVLILATGFFIRAVPVWTDTGNAYSGLGVFGDTIAYMSTAENLIKGKGFSQAPDGNTPSVLRTPLYPLFLAGCLSIKGWSLEFFRIVQCFVDMGTVLLLTLSAGLLVRGKRGRLCGLLAAMLGTFCPYFIFYSRQLLSESQTAFLMAFCLFANLKAQIEHKKKVWWLVAGTSFALAGLTRPDAGWSILFLLPVHFFLLKKKGTNTVCPLGALIVGFVLCVAPWTARNISEFGRPIPFSAGNLGLNLYMGTWEESSKWMEDGWVFPPDSGPPKEREEVDRLTRELQLIHIKTGGKEMFAPDQRLFEIAKRRILDDPLAYLKLCLKRILRLWWFDSYDKYHLPEPGAVYFVVYMILTLVGSWILIRDSDGLILIPWAVIAYVTLVHIPMHVEARFSLQAMPALIVLASTACQACAWTQIRPKPYDPLGQRHHQEAGGLGAMNHS